MSDIFSAKLHRFLWNFIKPQLKWFLCIAILPLALALEQIMFPYCTKFLIDIIVEFHGDKLNIYLEILPVLYVGLGVWILLVFIWRFLDIAEIYFMPMFQSRIHLYLFEYVQRHSYRYFSDEFSGSIAMKISDISNGSLRILNFIFKDLLPTIFSIFLSIIILSRINTMFSVIFMLFYFFHMGFCFYFSKKCNELSKIYSEKISLLYGMMVDSLTNIINVHLFSKHEYETQYFKRLQNSEINSNRQLLWRLFKIRLILELPSLLMIVAVMYFLIQGWQQGSISAGDFSFVVTLSFRIMISVWRLGFSFPNFFKEVGVCEQALKLIRLPHEVEDLPHASELIVKQGKIVFENVTFYHSKRECLFKNKNITIEKGKKTGLVGFSGSGKSTFVNLILRFFNIKNGRILIDEEDIATVTQDSLRYNIAVIPQDVLLFHRTFRDNIKYGNPNATEDEMIEASRKAYCHDFIMELERGYDTVVGERGINLSSGERQRIAIARAILKNAPIIILDEATSMLDSITEKCIQDSLNRCMIGRTVIVIAHRLSTLLDMDKILVFHKGKIVEQGNHHELLNKGGYYKKLWHMQANGFLPDQPNFKMDTFELDKDQKRINTVLSE